MPSPWTGRFWGRSLCSTNSTGGFSCATGDCGSGKIECSAAPMLPVTLAEFTIGNSAQDFYDVSVVDGYNLPLVVVPLHPQRGRECSSVGCVVDLNKTCPPELKVGREQPIACMSACQKFKDPVFCCTNTTVEECQPTLYSKSFKSECPLVYSYPLDDATSTFTCPNSPNYVITFCPSTLSNTTNSSVAEPPFPAQTNNGTLEPPSESQPSTETTPRAKQKSSVKLKLTLGVSAAALTVIIIILVAIMVRAKQATNRNNKNIEAVVMLRRYSYTKVKKMTNSFVHVLGRGGFGTVYKGKLPDNGQDVAVKILMEIEGNGEEFINEVASMSRTSHVNIVPLLGFCYEGKKRAIIYEFMSNGSLDKFISENMSTKMEWERLYNIAVGVSRGLEYLHNRCVPRIVHFDIKPQNILLDNDLCPKIADFGLARLCKNKESIFSMLDARGTFGYMAPEVINNNFGGVSHKSDVYSYGMVVLEMIGARNRENFVKSGSNNSSMYFPEWIYKDFERGETKRFCGLQVTEEEEKIAKKMLLVGLWCIQTSPSDRPAMIKVIEMLEGSIEALQVPPKPLLYLPPTAVQESVEDSTYETSIASNPSQFERGTLSGEDTLRFSRGVVHQNLEESQHSSRSSKVKVNKESGSSPYNSSRS
uniref:Glycerophosphodiester phosphodiesterase protein kinase domain-containing GDPDL2 n=1 Tax=Noccaea caerulescens TaxID=107243 RepID=A0A1J3DSY8_NOCCA